MNSPQLSWLQRALMALGHGYQRSLSWLVPVRCRFHPSCSNYYLEAIEKHGSLRGLRLTAWRLLRCQPFGRPGYDPVPERPSAAGTTETS